MPNESEHYAIGEHTKFDDGLTYLCVRVCDSTSLFEEPTTGDVFAEKELYFEFRNAAGEVRFVTLGTPTKVKAYRAPGPIKGIKPYFWKGVANDRTEEALGS